MKFGQNPCTIVQGLWPKFGATLKIRKKSKLDQNQFKLSTQHKYMYMHQIKLLKWRILSFSFLAKFGQNPCTIVQGLWPGFGATLKIRKKSKLDQNQFKLSTQHKYMYMHQIKLLKWRILSFSFLAKFGQNPCTIVQGLWPGFGATLKIRKKSKLDQNQFKLSTQHKYMYMHQIKL